MISYDGLWEILKEKKISKHSLTVYGGISASTIMRLNRNGSVNLTTIDALCNIIGCTPGDILSYTPAPTAGHREKPPVEMKDDANRGADESAEHVAADYGEGSLEGLPLNLQKGLDERGWSAADLSRASGVPRSSISNILAGRRGNPTCATVVALAHGLGITVEELIQD